LAVSLKVLAELSGCLTDLIQVRIGFFFVNAKNALESFQELDRSRALDLELQSIENFLLDIDQVFLRNFALHGRRQ